MTASLRIIGVSSANELAKILLDKQPREFMVFIMDEEGARIWHSTIMSVTKIVGALERVKFQLLHEIED